MTNQDINLSTASMNVLRNMADRLGEAKDAKPAEVKFLRQVCAEIAHREAVESVPAELRNKNVIQDAAARLREAVERFGADSRAASKATKDLQSWIAECGGNDPDPTPAYTYRSWPSDMLRAAELENGDVVKYRTDNLASPVGVYAVTEHDTCDLGNGRRHVYLCLNRVDDGRPLEIKVSHGLPIEVVGHGARRTSAETEPFAEILDELATHDLSPRAADYALKLARDFVDEGFSVPDAVRAATSGQANVFVVSYDELQEQARVLTDETETIASKGKVNWYEGDLRLARGIVLDGTDSPDAVAVIEHGPTHDAGPTYVCWSEAPEGSTLYVDDVTPAFTAAVRACGGYVAPNEGERPGFIAELPKGTRVRHLGRSDWASRTGRMFLLPNGKQFKHWGVGGAKTVLRLSGELVMKKEEAPKPSVTCDVCSRVVSGEDGPHVVFADDKGAEAKVCTTCMDARFTLDGFRAPRNARLWVQAVAGELLELGHEIGSRPGFKNYGVEEAPGQAGAVVTVDGVSVVIRAIRGEVVGYTIDPVISPRRVEMRASSSPKQVAAAIKGDVQARK